MNTTTIALDVSADFLPHELPFAHFSDCLHEARQRLLHAIPGAAAIINAEFGSLEDRAAKLPTQLKHAG